MRAIPFIPSIYILKMTRLEKYGYELLWKTEIILVCKCGRLMKTYSNAIAKSDKLNELLDDAGLKVSSFEVFNEERPGNKIQSTGKPIVGEKFLSGITVDIEA